MSVGTRYRTRLTSIGRLVALSAATLALGASTVSAAPTQFAEFSNGGANDRVNGFRWDNFDNTQAFFDTAVGGAPVTFTYTNLPGLAPELQGPQAAHIR